MRKDFLQRYGPWAVVAGASEGMGAQFASQLARRGLNLVLIARREESLWEELGPRGVDVIACRAGATRTPGYQDSKPRGRIPVMEPAAVVAQALGALGRGPSMVPGWFNRVTSFLMVRLLSRRMAVRVM